MSIGTTGVATQREPEMLGQAVVVIAAARASGSRRPGCPSHASQKWPNSTRTKGARQTDGHILACAGNGK